MNMFGIDLPPRAGLVMMSEVEHIRLSAFGHPVQRKERGWAREESEQVACTRQGRTPVPGSQAPLWLHQGPLPGLGQEHPRAVRSLRTGESGHGAATAVSSHIGNVRPKSAEELDCGDPR